MIELSQLQVMLKGRDITACFVGAPGSADLKWSLKVIDGLPDSIIPDIYIQYLKRRKSGATHNAIEENTWLRERVQWFKALLRSFPVSIHQIRNEEHRAIVATDWANQTANILNTETNGNTEPQESDALFEKVSGPANQWGFVPEMPKFKTVDSKHKWIAGVMVRLLDAAWWTRKINRAWDRYTEHAAILIGKVRRGVSPYLSFKNLNIYRQRKAAAKRWMQQMMVVNQEFGLELSLEEAVAKSVSNPLLRRHELMVRMRGFEDMAAELGYIGLFVTWTAPSKFHSWRQAANGKVVENKKYNGSTPQQTQKYLSKLWSCCRSTFARNNINVFGFRVVEPHHDATPHWHMLLFVRPDQMAEVVSHMQWYALTDDKAELIRTKTKLLKSCPPFTDITPRFDWKIMDPKEGGATGYIAKYIAKNLDGHAVGDDWEAETPAEEGAVSAGAWANWHGIRQFQQIGGPSVSVWRELRRLKDPAGPSRDQVLESIRRAATYGKWELYTELMGGPVLPRSDRPVKLMNITKDAANKYGEDVQKIMGVFGHIEERQSRLEGWEVTKYGLDAREHTSSAARKGSASTGRAEGAAPWSSDNNCTEPDGNSADQLLKEHFRQLGLDKWMIELLHKKAIIRDDDRYIWLRDGQLHISTKHPNFDGSDDAINREFETEINRTQAENVAAIRQEMWKVIETGSDIDEWLNQNSAADQEIALHQLGDIVEQLEYERYQQEYTKQHGSKYNLWG